MALLWPQHSPSAARHSLSESLHVLRKGLGDGILVSVGDDVALAPDGPLHSDVQAFQDALDAGRLEEAVDLYAAPLLGGFHVSGAPEFEWWVDGERDRLARACVDALERLAAPRGGDGRVAAASSSRRCAGWTAGGTIPGGSPSCTSATIRPGASWATWRTGCGRN